MTLATLRTGAGTRAVRIDDDTAVDRGATDLAALPERAEPGGVGHARQPPQPPAAGSALVARGAGACPNAGR